MDNLDDRKQAILSALVEDFIYSAEPVGSKRLVEKYGWSISPATVRNELAILEEWGYLSHPHTSAGRVPTDKGYRQYVDGLAEAVTFAAADQVEVGKFFDRLSHEIDALMRETSQFLSQLTSAMAIVYAPEVRHEKIKHIDLIGLGSCNLMIVVIMSGGSISKHVVSLGEDFPAEILGRVEGKLNDDFSGRSFNGGKPGDGAASELGGEEKELFDLVALSIGDAARTGASERVYYEGAAQLLDYPEMADLNEMRRLMVLMERNYSVLEWLNDTSKSPRLMVSIGSEHALELTGYTVIASGYEVRGEAVGVLGVLGPTRMDYRRSISAVSHIASELGKALADLEN